MTGGQPLLQSSGGAAHYRIFPPQPDILGNQPNPLVTYRRLAYIASRQRAGRPRLAQARRGKSGLHGTTVPGNARPVLARVSRESATERIPPAFGRVRSKGCGKSAPRRRQRHRHGKPHRVQDRIGAAYGPVPARRPGWLLEGQGNLPPRGMVAQAQQCAGQNPAYRPSGDFRRCERSEVILVRANWIASSLRTSQ